jgi:hypothetical protein
VTSKQQRRLQDVAMRFGCWPNDVTTTYRGELVDATIGEHKGRPKRIVIKPGGRVLNREEVADLEARGTL